MKNANFDTDLTDDQWQFLKPLLPKPKVTGRPRTCLRKIINSLLYITKAGCQWRLLPSTFPRWQTVYHVFRKWTSSCTLSAIHDRLRAYAREMEGKACRPTAAILDSQTVRSAGFPEEVGYDAGKKTKGRKRFVIVDTLGFILGVIVVPANQTEREGAKELLESVLNRHGWLRKLWVDGGYSGVAFSDWIHELRPNVDVEVVKRSDQAVGFQVVPKRWIVERTFGWLMQCRRLVRDYERTVDSAVAWIHLAMMRVMLRRIA